MRGTDAGIDPRVGVRVDERRRFRVEAELAREESEAAAPSPPFCPDMVPQRNGQGFRVVT